MPISSSSRKYHRNRSMNEMKDWKRQKTQEVFLHGEGRQASPLLQDIVLALLLVGKKASIILLLRLMSIIIPMLNSP